MKLTPWFIRVNQKLTALAVAAAALLCGTLFNAQVASAQLAVEMPAGGAEPGAEKTITRKYKQSVIERTEVTIIEEKEELKPEPKKRYAAAIFIANRADKVDDKKVLVLQDLLMAYATRAELGIIAREDVVNSVSKLAKKGPNAGGSEIVKDLDGLLSKQTSAKALADQMNADFVLMATISSYGSRKIDFRDADRGIQVSGHTSQLRLTYRLLDMARGASVSGGVATVTRTFRHVPGQGKIVDDTVLDDLLDAAAFDLASTLRRVEPKNVVAEKTDKVPFRIFVGVADLMAPEVTRNADGELIVTAGRYKTEAIDAVVELNGVAIGFTGTELKARPGLQKLRLKRANFKDWEGFVNIQKDMKLSIDMSMTPDARQRFTQAAKFFSDLKKDMILTEAQVKRAEAYAKSLERGGIQLDPRTDLRVVRRSNPELKLELKVGGEDDEEEGIRIRE